MKKLFRVLFLFFLLAAAFVYGYFFHRNHVFPYNAVHTAYQYVWSFSPSRTKNQKLPPRLRVAAKDTSKLTAEQAEEMEKLASLGYTSGDMKPVQARLGVTIHKQEALDGFNYFTSGNGPEATLMDMDGRVLHKWKFGFESFWPEHPPLPKSRSYWRRAYLYPNGDLLAIFEGNGLMKLNKDSRMIWGFREPVHHALDVRPDGTIYVLTRRPRMIDELNTNRPILEDFITILDSNGKLKKNISLIQAFQKSIYFPILKRSHLFGDVLHTNSIKVLDGAHEAKSPVFKNGNLLISCAHIDTIAIVDPRDEKVVYATTGMWREQHEPVLLPNGNLMVFDNQGPVQGSRIIEIDPITRELRWTYEAKGFYSHSVGSAQRLSNGNTLITESWAGRVFEVNQKKEIVWEFHNPSRAGDKSEYVAIIPEMKRIPKDFPMDWLAQSK